jgi:hypothetical protein
MRGFLVTALLATVAGCASLGYEGRGCTPTRMLRRHGGGPLRRGRLGRTSVLSATIVRPHRYGGRDATGWAGRVTRLARPRGTGGSGWSAGIKGLQGPTGPTVPTGPTGGRAPRGSLGPSGTWSSPENVQFEFKEGAIQSKCADKIPKIVTWMTANPHVAIGLDGHVDDAQANDNDPTLSAARDRGAAGAHHGGHRARPDLERRLRESRSAVPGFLGELPLAQPAGGDPRRPALMSQ